MIKMTILFREPADTDAFEKFYVMNLKLLERIPNVARREVSHVYGSPDGEVPYFREYTLYFDDRDTLDDALKSYQGVEAGKYMMSRAAELVEIFFSEIYEESGGSTPTDKGHTPVKITEDNENTEDSETESTTDADVSKPVVVDLDEQIL